MTKRLALIIPILLMMALAPLVPAPALAQDENPNPTILLCAEGVGCWHSDKSGEINDEQMSVLIGEEDPHGEGTVICTPSDRCTWTALTPEDADVLVGGEGEVDGEKSDPPDESETKGDGLFGAMEVEDPQLVPVEGNWTTYNLAGTMNCPGIMTLDIPASEPITGPLTAPDDGMTLTAQSPDPETAMIDMLRVQDGVYHATLEMTVDGNTLTMDFDSVYVANTIAFGMIHGEIEAQGYLCYITRPFFATVEGMDLIQETASDEAMEDAEMDDADMEETDAE